MTRGAAWVLLVVLSWGAAGAGAESNVAWGESDDPSDDVYVCVDPSAEGPGVYLSTSDCASGVPDSVTFSVYDSNTGTWIIIHLKSCIEASCVQRVCIDSCDPWCVLNAVCVHSRCLGPLCERDCLGAVACYRTGRP